MKKILILCLFCFSFFISKAQSDAIGVRLSGGGLVNSEVSLQKWVTDYNRLELDAGFGGGSLFNIFSATAIYQSVFEIDYGLNWFLGIGAGSGFWEYHGEIINGQEGGVFINAAAQIGAEYYFDIPLQIGFDYRLEFGVLNSYDKLDANFGLSVRYAF